MYTVSGTNKNIFPKKCSSLTLLNTSRPRFSFRLRKKPAYLSQTAGQKKTLNIRMNMRNYSCSIARASVSSGVLSG